MARSLEDLLNATPDDVQVFFRGRLSQACIRAPGEAEWTSFTADTPATALRRALESRQPIPPEDDLI